MKKLLRITTLTALAAVTLLLLMAEADSLTALLATKAAGFAAGFATYRLSLRWEDTLNELNI